MDPNTEQRAYCGSTQMLKIYANFSDKEINNSIFEKYGLKTELVGTLQERRSLCNYVLKLGEKFNSQCALVLDQATGLKLEKDTEELNFFHS